MKKSLLITLLTLIGSVLPAASEEAKDCAPISTTVTQEVTAKPTDVLSIVSAQIASNPTCACEIVKAAITASKANKDLVGQIVFAAVTAAPAEATTIAECAVAVAPEASETIKAALKGAMTDDKNPGKNVVDKNPPPPPQDDLADFGLSPVAIGGVYLVYPSGGGTGGVEVVTRTVTRTRTVTKTRVIVLTVTSPPDWRPSGTLIAAVILEASPREQGSLFFAPGLRATPRVPMAAKRKGEPESAPKPANLHFIHGSDDARVKEAALGLVRELAPPDAGEFGTEVIDGGAENAEHAARLCGRAIEAMQTLPLFGGSKLVWLRNVTFLGDTPTARAETTVAALDRLLAFLEPGLPADVRFILSAGAPDKRRSFFLRFSKLADTRMFDVPDYGGRGGEAQLEAAVVERASAAGLSFDPDAMEVFLLLVGERTQQIINEIEKLDLYLGPDRRRVTVQDVRSLVPASRAGIIFELGNAIGRRDARRALALLGPLLEQGESAIGLLLAAIIPKMRNLLLVGDLVERFRPPLQSYPGFVRHLESLPDEELAHLPRKKDGGLNVYPLFLAAQESNHFTAAEVRAGLQACLRANHRLVSSSLAPDVVLSQLIVELTVGSRRRPPHPRLPAA